MAVALSSSDSAVIERSVDADSHGYDDLTGDRISEVFEIERCVSWAQEKGLKEPTLQFPDG